MNEEDFYYLYVNANCLAELGLKAAGRELESLLSDCEPAQINNEMSAIPNNLDDLDFSAMEGLDFYDESSSSASKAPSEDDQAAMDASLKAMEADLAMMSQTENVQDLDSQVQLELKEESFDLDIYMRNAYAQKDAIQEQASKAYSRANIELLSTYLNDLPDELPSLLKALSGDDMAKWQSAYLTDQTNVMAIVTEIRSLSEH